VLGVARWGQPDQAIELSYRYDFLTQPNVPDTVDGTLERSESFQIDIQTGNALPNPRTELLSLPTQEYTHLTMLVSAGFDRPIWVHLNRLGEIGAHTNEYLTLSNGDRVRRSTAFVLGKIYVSDFRAISWDFDTGDYNRRFEYGVALDEQGEIIEILQCGRDREFTNPTCTFSFRDDPLRVGARFNKRQLPWINLIRNHAQTFVACLR